MSDINITKTIYVDAKPVAPVNQPSSVRENAGLNVNAAEQKAESAPAYEDVVAVSEDGDTVQAKPESYERLSEGFVFAKAKENVPDDNKTDEVKAETVKREQSIAADQAQKSSDAREERNEARIKEAIRDAQEKASEAKEILQDQIEEKNADAKAADSAAASKISFSSMSGSDLERMYLTGQISSYAYNSEIESRQAEVEKAGRDNAELSETAAAAQTQIETNNNLGRAMTGEEFGAGYETREEQDLAREALFGKEVENSNTSNAAFEINLTK